MIPNFQSWMLATMEYFDDHIPGNTAKLSAIILLSAFGPSCDQIDDHYDKDNDLSRSQRGVLEDVFTHTDWELLSDMVPGIKDFDNCKITVKFTVYRYFRNFFRGKENVFQSGPSHL